jgi:hypothetical protein
MMATSQSVRMEFPDKVRTAAVNAQKNKKWQQTSAEPTAEDHEDRSVSGQAGISKKTISSRRFGERKPFILSNLGAAPPSAFEKPRPISSKWNIEME